MKEKSLKLITILSTVFCLAACQGQNKGSLYGDYSDVIKKLNVKELRNPDGLEHVISFGQLNDSNYSNFKDKMMVFSTKLSELFVKSDYDIKSNIAISPLSIEMCLGLAVYCDLAVGGVAGSLRCAAAGAQTLRQWHVVLRRQTETDEG